MISAGTAFAACDDASLESANGGLALDDGSAPLSVTEIGELNMQDDNPDDDNEITDENSNLNKANGERNETTIINDGAKWYPLSDRTQKVYHVDLLDEDGVILEGKEVEISFNGAVKNCTVGPDGIDYLINNPGTKGDYPIVMKFYGDEAYAPNEATAIITYSTATATRITANEATYTLADVLNNKSSYTFYIAYSQKVFGVETWLPLSGAEIEFRLNGKTETYTTILGVITYPVRLEEAGEYTLEMNYYGSSNYAPASTAVKITVLDVLDTKISAAETIDYDIRLVNNSLALYPIFLTDQNNKPLNSREINITFNGKTETIKTNFLGEVTYIVKGVGIGDHPIEISYYGDEGFNPSSFSGTITVTAVKSQINAEDANISLADVEHDEAVYEFSLTDGTGILPLANKTVKVTFNDGETKEYQTNWLGQVECNITGVYALGTYPLKIEFEGDTEYESCEATVNITIVHEVDTKFYSLPVMSYDSRLVMTNLALYPIVLTDKYNHLLRDKTVEVTFNGETKTYTTNFLGEITYVIKAEETGIYLLEMAFAGDEDYNPSSSTALITITAAQTEFHAAEAAEYDLADVYDGTAIYSLFLTDNIGLPLNNKTVSIKFNGKTEEYATNILGYISYKIDAEPGNYTLEMAFDGDNFYGPTRATSNITINEAADTEIHALETAEYDARIVMTNLALYPLVLTDADGKLLYNKTVSITFNGETREYTTNLLGEITYLIKVEEAGEYTLEMAFEGGEGYNPCIAFANIIVTSAETEINALESAEYRIGDVLDGAATFGLLLTDDLGLPLANKTVLITFNGETQGFTTNWIGYINYVIMAEEAGEYTLEMAFKGDNFYAPSYATANITILPPTETVIHALEDVEYDARLVLNNLALYPLVLTDIDGRLLSFRNVTITFNGETKNYTTNLLGEITFLVKAEAGNYTIEMTYDGEKYYAPTTATGQIKIVPSATNIIALETAEYKIDDVLEGDATFGLILTDDLGLPLANKTVAITFNGETQEFNTNWIGYINYVIMAEEAGEYTLEMAFKGDGYYAPTNATANITIVPPTETVIHAPEDVEYDSRIVMSDLALYPLALTDTNGKALGCRNVTVTFNGETKNYTTDIFGEIIVPIKAEAGNYTIEMTYNGEKYYAPATATGQIRIIPAQTKIYALEFAEYEAGDVLTGKAKFGLLLFDDLGLPLANKTVVIKFNEGTEELKTNWIGYINYELPPTASGEYPLEMVFEGDGFYAPTNATAIIIIDQPIATQIDGFDYVEYNIVDVILGGATYTLILTDSSGIPLADKTVSITFNGETDNYLTDENGTIDYKILAEAGIYTLEMAFAGDEYYSPASADATINIIPIGTEISALDKVVFTVNEVINGTAIFDLTLYNAYGYALNDQNISITFNDNTKEYITDENGTIHYEIAAGAGNYTLEMNFKGNGFFGPSNATATVEIVKERTLIYLRNALFYVLGPQNVRITLWDGNGKPIAGKTVYVTVEGKTYSGVTNEDGDAYIKVALKYGNYTATVSFDEDDQYLASNRTGTIRIIKQTPGISATNTAFSVNQKTKTVKVTLLSPEGKPLPVHQMVGIKINGKMYIGYTDSNGVANVNIDINEKGYYQGELKYGGNSAYNAVSRKVNISIK